ncbi:MAG: NAD(P)-binding domain-containing protein [Micrococcales bacterium]|nr:NAD(P)-binding domain-containing protein [Micrococcales bacterium]
MERTDVLVIGAGQAGLAASHELTSAGVEHLVLDRARIGQAWTDRWDSFCLVTPSALTLNLPGMPYDGDDPEGYLSRAGIVEYLQRYAAGAPVRQEVEVRSLERRTEGFRARTSQGEFSARRVVVATGAYQRPYRPPGAASLPPSLPALDLSDYRNPSVLPPGRVLVVGSGQSGCQIAEELHQAGRDIVLACGRAPWLHRRIAGRDMFWWAVESGFLDQPVASLPGPQALLFANVQGSGRDGGHDLHYRTLHDMGVTLAGHFDGAREGRIHFVDDLPNSVAWGDARRSDLLQLFARTAQERGLPKPDSPEPDPFREHGPASIPLAALGAVVFAGGFRPDYRAWLPWPEAFDATGFPLQKDGRSTVIDDLYFLGVHFMRTRRSSLMFGVGDDAKVVAAAIAGTAPGA